MSRSPIVICDSSSSKSWRLISGNLTFNFNQALCRVFKFGCTFWFSYLVYWWYGTPIKAAKSSLSISHLCRQCLKRFCMFTLLDLNYCCCAAIDCCGSLFNPRKPVKSSNRRSAILPMPLLFRNLSAANMYSSYFPKSFCQKVLFFFSSACAICLSVICRNCSSTHRFLSTNSFSRSDSFIRLSLSCCSWIL